MIQISSPASSTNAGGVFIRTLYPALTVAGVHLEAAATGIPADGVAVADKLLTQTLPGSGTGYLCMAEKVPHKLLGHLDRIAAFITLNEDSSTHSAIVSRAQGVPIINVSRADFDRIRAAAGTLSPGQAIGIDTFTGRVVIGNVTLISAGVPARRQEAMARISQSCRLKVHANADTAADLRAAQEHGFTHAWPRSETLLYDKHTLSAFIAFLLDPASASAEAGFVKGHSTAIAALYSAAKNSQITFRLLDPPSHEFLPDADDHEEVGKIADILGITPNATLTLMNGCRETNPMIGHRGARLLLTNPALLRAQIVSIFTGWLDADSAVRPLTVNILVPFVMVPAELQAVRAAVEQTKASDVRFAAIPVRFGAMVELPSLLDYPEQVADLADFVSFGTNDLVSVTHGISRGDSYSRYLRHYLDTGLMDRDPFFQLPEFIIQKIETFCLRARAVNPALETDICGEQALMTDLSRLVRSGALTSVSIGAANLPVLIGTLLETGLLSLEELHGEVLCQQAEASAA